MSSTTHAPRLLGEQPALTDAAVGPCVTTYADHAAEVEVPSENSAMRAPSPSCGVAVAVYWRRRVGSGWVVAGAGERR